jgi:DNA-binding transcriptional ArsR family regulator
MSKPLDKDFGTVAALVGDPVRANILWTLLDGRAFTATELAINVDSSPQNLSMHLAKLIGAGFISVAKQGRHRYYTYSRPEVAYAVEALAALLPPKQRSAVRETDVPIRTCRTCYDHLAGRLGVQVTESLVQKKLIEPGPGIFTLTAKGIRWFSDFGVDCETLQTGRRSFARACVDWTERRPHLAGALGAALLKKMMEEHWLRRMKDTRAVLLTPKGRKAMSEIFGLAV